MNSETAVSSFVRSNRKPVETVEEKPLHIYEVTAHGSVVNGTTSMLRAIYYFVLSIVLTFLFVVESLTKVLRTVCVGISFLCSEFNTYFVYTRENKPKLYIFSCIVVGVLLMTIVSLSLLLYSSY